eukprot:3787718-Rhodomonas_salina.1
MDADPEAGVIPTSDSAGPCFERCNLSIALVTSVRTGRPEASLRGAASEPEEHRRQRQRDIINHSS